MDQTPPPYQTTYPMVSEEDARGDGRSSETNPLLPRDDHINSSNDHNYSATTTSPPSLNLSTAVLRKQILAMSAIERRQQSRLFSCRCLLSLFMLALFLALAAFFTRAIFFNIPYSNNTPLSQENTYDFIIVGAGPAGSILTRKLVDAGASVLLIEAGTASQFNLGRDIYSIYITYICINV